MEKWAYVRLVVENVGQQRVPTVVNRSPNLNGVKEVNLGDSLDKWLECMGRNGWKLVGVLSSGETEHLLFCAPY